MNASISSYNQASFKHESYSLNEKFIPQYFSLFTHIKEHSLKQDKFKTDVESLESLSDNIYTDVFSKQA